MLRPAFFLTFHSWNSAGSAIWPGVRDKARWDLGAALDHCLAVIKLLLDNTAFLKPAVFSRLDTFRKFDFSSWC